MKVKIIVDIYIPDGATHYLGDITDQPAFYKCTQVGIAGDHWWYWDSMKQQWKFSGHSMPHWIKEIQFVNAPGGVNYG